MHTSLGGRFFPTDPRPEEVFMSDIANGLAMENRYSGQNRVDRFYSVAEHSALMAQFMLRTWPTVPKVAFVALLHDAHEAYGIRDVNRAGKWALNHEGSNHHNHYDVVAGRIQRAIWKKYNLAVASIAFHDEVKRLDQGMVPLEKAMIFRHSQAWYADKFLPPKGVQVTCLNPIAAKEFFVGTYWKICFLLEIDPEEIEI